MRLAASILALAVFALPLGAQETSATATPKDQKPQKCVILGQVVKAGTNEPLKKAYVILTSNDREEQPTISKTDAGGQFLFKEVEPGRYHLEVNRHGYVRQEYGQRSANQSGTILVLGPGQKLEGVIFRMVLASVISGRVMDEDGEPVPWVHVEALRLGHGSGKRRLTSSGDTTTNDLGEYRVFGLTPGRYYVAASYSPEMKVRTESFQFSGSSGSGESYAPTFYPGTGDPERAAAIEVKPGEEASSINFQLLPVKTYRIRGHVTNEVTGSMTGQIEMRAFRTKSAISEYGIHPATIDPAKGTFEIRGLTPGSYTVMAFLRDPEKYKFYEAQQLVDIGGADVEGISLTITRGVDVPGRILVEGGSGLEFDKLNIGINQEGSGFFWNDGGKVRPDGSFVLPNLSEGDYEVYVRGLPSDSFVKSARMGTDDVLDSAMTVTRSNRSSLEITVSKRGGRIDGLVLDADSLPVNGVGVALIPDPPLRNKSQRYRAATTDQFGRFALRGIPPGDYKLFSWEEVEEGEWFDPDFLKPFEDQGKSAHVEEGSQQSTELKLIPASKPEQKP